MSVQLPNLKPHYRPLPLDAYHAITRVWSRAEHDYVYEQLSNRSCEYYCAFIAHGWHGYELGRTYDEPPEPVEGYYETIIVRPRYKCWGKGIQS